MIKYGSIYKHKYEMVGWCSKIVQVLLMTEK